MSLAFQWLYCEAVEVPFLLFFLLSLGTALRRVDTVRHCWRYLATIVVRSSLISVSQLFATRRFPIIELKTFFSSTHQFSVVFITTYRSFLRKLSSPCLCQKQVLFNGCVGCQIQFRQEQEQFRVNILFYRIDYFLHFFWPCRNTKEVILIQ